MKITLSWKCFLLQNGLNGANTSECI